MRIKPWSEKSYCWSEISVWFFKLGVKFRLQLYFLVIVGVQFRLLQLDSLNLLLFYKYHDKRQYFTVHEKSQQLWFAGISGNYG